MVEGQQLGGAMAQVKVPKIPWQQLEEYIKTHDLSIGSLISVKNAETLPLESLEQGLPKAFLTVRSSINKIFRDNNINDEEKEKVKVIVEAVMSIQDEFLTKRNKDSRKIESIMSSLKPSLEKSLDKSMHSHIDGVLSQLAGMGDFFESKFD